MSEETYWQLAYLIGAGGWGIYASYRGIRLYSCSFRYAALTCLLNMTLFPLAVWVAALQESNSTTKGGEDE